MDNLSDYKLDDLRRNLIRFTIPTGRNNDNTILSLEALDSMNINRITLFPGLDGFAESFEPRTKCLFERYATIGDYSAKERMRDLLEEMRQN